MTVGSVFCLSGDKISFSNFAICIEMMEIRFTVSLKRIIHISLILCSDPPWHSKAHPELSAELEQSLHQRYLSKANNKPLSQRPARRSDSHERKGSHKSAHHPVTSRLHIHTAPSPQCPSALMFPMCTVYVSYEYCVCFLCVLCMFPM